MAISKLEVGAVPLGVGGDSLRSAAAKINANFDEVDSRIADVESRPIVDTSLTGRVNILEPEVAAATAAIGNIALVLDAINGV